MKVLYFGGQKSGKSSLAEEKARALTTSRPMYIATYDNSFNDLSMQQRIDRHISDRNQYFNTIEQPRNLPDVVTGGNTYLIDCVSMWIFNNIDQDEESLKNELAKLFSLECNIVFVLNDVGCGVIPADSLSRRFVDLSGIIGQFIAKHCDEVFEVKYGLTNQLK
jgi:adenosylcobinamide kinase/adenosylcobinamide-phosphate guanylyltransferase